MRQPGAAAVVARIRTCSRFPGKRRATVYVGVPRSRRRSRRRHLHELDPAWRPPTKLDRTSAFDKMGVHVATFSGLVADLALCLVEHLRRLAVEIDELAAEVTSRTTMLAPSLLAIPGCAALTAAKILGETAGIDRFRSKDSFARHNGTAPQPVWSSNHARHRLSRTGNRQLNAAIHWIVLTQARCHEDGRRWCGICPVRSSAWQGRVHVGCELVSELNTLLRNDLVTRTPARHGSSPRRCSTSPWTGMTTFPVWASPSCADRMGARSRHRG
uniref:Transposase IS116/IS110/IS902 C-terminal domain-containing protein n=1 Tax=Rhodococcus sp. NS1 TaxID=402236 RepID=A0A097SQH4_9NOCA|nr:hypothetical protein LRS1606.331 [Rhodococcus sp. NS1]